MRFNMQLIPMVMLALVASPAFAQDDEVRIQGIDAGEQVRVMVNARKKSGDGCIARMNGSPLKGNEWDERNTNAAGLVRLGNLQSGCILTLAAFSKKRAMFLASFDDWKDEGGERRVVTMKPLIDVPIVIWITHKDLESVAHSQVKTASILYTENMVGFNFIPTFENVSGDPEKVKIIESALVTIKKNHDCSKVENLKKATVDVFRVNTLNVYYVKRDGFDGRNCAIMDSPKLCRHPELDEFPKKDGNVTFIGAGLNLPRLAHELGHAFGLRPAVCGGHVDKLPSFENNIMGGGGDKRNWFSLGQVFRMSTQEDKWGGSMIIANKLRPVQDGRPCHLLPLDASTESCPPLNLGSP